ncbi:MAG TPA: hypothetical protein VLS88_09595 [Polyangiales bacterium]|nr:hypothetical protein [Polyangiales bacterium]
MTGLRIGSGVLVVVSVVVIGVVAGGVWLMGSPGEQRVLKLDERRIDDLQSIAHQIHVYWNRYHALPEELEALGAEPGFAPIPTDPIHDQPYDYRLLGQESYELCAVFDRPSRYAPGSVWTHEAGRYCFKLKGDTLAPR